MRWLITRYATDVIAVSKSALDSALPGRWQSKRDCKVVYNGTDVAPFRVPEDRVGVREEFGWPADSRIVVNVGRLSAQKNHRVILETVRLVHRQDGSVRLLLIGAGSSTGGGWPHRPARFREICAITNNRPDVPRLLRPPMSSSSSSWGLPGALLEALAAGLPIVASDIPPIREIATFFPGSILVAPRTMPSNTPNTSARRCGCRGPGERAAAVRRSPFSFQESVSAYRALYGIHELAGPAASPPVRAER